MEKQKSKEVPKVHPIFDFLKILLKRKKRRFFLSADKKIFFDICFLPDSNIEVEARSRSKNVRVLAQEFKLNYRDYGYERGGFINVLSLFSSIPSLFYQFPCWSYQKKLTLDRDSSGNKELNGLMAVLEKAKEIDMSGKQWADVVLLS